MSSINDLQVSIKGNFFDAGGYAKVNRNLATGLSSLGVKVTVDALGKGEDTSSMRPDERKKILSLRGKPDRHSIKIDSMIPCFPLISNGAYKILYTTVEAYSLPEQFVSVANMYEEIWVTSDFCKEVISQYIKDKPIIVIPDSINADFYNMECKPYPFNPPLNKFVFLSVFGWNYRKGPDVLLKSYLNEFSANDNVSLLIVSRYQGREDKNSVIKNSISESILKHGGKNPAHIARFAKVISESDMPSIYKAANAFVLFSRGEGFCVPYCEASLCGLPVIATNCSGHSMFLKNDNSTLIPIDSLIPLQPGLCEVDYWNNQKMPSLSLPRVIEDARKAMRYVYENYREAKVKNQILKKQIAENYSIKAVSQKALDRLLQIKEKVKP